jgi:5,10-methenyltetrahydrofolate synthetase
VLTNTLEEKKYLRTSFLKARKSLYYASKPHDWGPRQFLNTLRALKIKSMAELNQNYHVACYFPIQFELNLWTFASAHWLFPKMCPQGELEWFEYGDGTTGYTRNKNGILEKAESTPYMPGSKPLLCFVPALAVSPDGHRLGYGGGYYDRFLSRFKDTHMISVCCIPNASFVCPTLPTLPTDQKVDWVVE